MPRPSTSASVFAAVKVSPCVITPAMLTVPVGEKLDSAKVWSENCANSIPVTVSLPSGPEITHPDGIEVKEYLM